MRSSLGGQRGVRSKRLPFTTALIAFFMGSAYLLAQSGKEAGEEAGGAHSRRLAPTNHTLEVGCHPLEPWEEEGTGILFYTALLIYAFVGLAVVCDDFFVASLEQISEHLKLSDDVAGATFMAAGSSAPELFVSLADNVLTEPGKAIGIGTIIGSAIFNICVIIAVTSVLAGKALKLDWRPMARDSMWYTVSIAVLFWAVEDRQVDAVESVVLLLGYIGYIVFMAHNEAWMNAIGRKLGKEQPEDNISSGAGAGAGVDMGTGAIEAAATVAAPAVMALTISKTASLNAAEDDPTDESVGAELMNRQRRSSSVNPLHSSANRALNTRRSVLGSAVGSVLGGEGSDAAASNSAIAEIDLEGSGGGGVEEDDELGEYWDVITQVPDNVSGKAWWLLTLPLSLGFKLSIPDCRFARWQSPCGFISTFVMSIVWIGALTFAVVHSVEKIGCALAIPFPLLALTVVAAGTSIPDALASVLVARQGQGDMAVSNAIGSNIFDIFLGLGLPFLLSNIIYGKPVRVGAGDDYEELIISICILLGTVVAVVLIIRRANWMLEPRVGASLFAIYVGYVIFAYVYNEQKKG
jgi:K+-dependent Na+/Ca+ exchanger-like protein